MELKRRELFGLLRPRWNAVPAIETAICTATWGCRVCVPSCPRKALVERDGVVEVEDRLCDGCGCCGFACPWGALRPAGYAPGEIDRTLKSLLSGENKPGGSAIVLLHCSGAEERLNNEGLPRSVLPLRLPCLATPLPFVVLRAFELGARGVALLPCAGDCRYGFNLERMKEDVRFLHSVMGATGVDQSRLQVLGTGPRRQLEEMAEQLSKQPVAAAAVPEPRSKPFPFPSLVIADLLKNPQQSPGFTLYGKGIPCGLVEVQGDRCSLCGLCARMCLSRALTLEKRQGKLALVFHHAFCAACGECVRICLDGALKLRRGLDTRLLEDLRVLVEADMAQCRLCGKNITAAPMLQKLQGRLASSDLKLENTLDLCPACRTQRFLRTGVGALEPRMNAK